VRLLERLYDPVPHQERTPVGGLLVVDGLHRVPQRDDAILRQGKCGRVRGPACRPADGRGSARARPAAASCAG
jgi:hypothetical protein